MLSSDNEPDIDREKKAISHTDSLNIVIFLLLIQRGSDMDRQDQIRKELIEKKLHDGIIKLSSRFDFDIFF